MFCTQKTVVKQLKDPTAINFTLNSVPIHLKMFMILAEVEKTLFVNNVHSRSFFSL